MKYSKSILLGAFIFWWCRAASASEPACVCNLSECEPLTMDDCPFGSNLVLDPCNCCRQCARLEHQPCGGEFGFRGICATGLRCVVEDFSAPVEEGVCARVGQKVENCDGKILTFAGCNVIDHECECARSEICEPDSAPFMGIAALTKASKSKVKSPFIFKTLAECKLNLDFLLKRNVLRQRLARSLEIDEYEVTECPNDSELLDGKKCVCAPHKCPVDDITDCGKGLIKELAFKAIGRPSQCCDIYHCVPANFAVDCSRVSCPGNNQTSCPPDSYRLPSHKSPGQCCSEPSECHCLEHSCITVECAPTSTPTLIRDATGKPGSCCPLYECVTKKELSTSVTDVNPEGCISPDGKMYAEGSTWQDDTACVNCVCRDGRIDCHTYLCQATCHNNTLPVYVDGECCPVCPNVSETVALTTELTAVDACPPLNNCAIHCEYGYVVDDKNCIVCECPINPPSDECAIDCGTGFRIDSLGNRYCSCPKRICEPLENCALSCPRGYIRDYLGCDTCACNKCRHNEYCDKSCYHGYRLDDEYCPMCECASEETDEWKVGLERRMCETEGGKWRDDGETWYDGCRHCYCSNGKEMCSLIYCPLPGCENAISNSSSCCPFCVDEQRAVAKPHMHMVCSTATGKIMLDGQRWLTADCTECICLQGRVLCYSQPCLPVACAKPIFPPGSGQCCPQCADEDALINVTSLVRDQECTLIDGNSKSWKEGSCKTCRCSNGKVICNEELCQTNACALPLHVKNKCCPICLDKSTTISSAVCVTDKGVYTVGEHYMADSCTSCTCTSEYVRCLKETCPPICYTTDDVLPCCMRCPDTKYAMSVDSVIYLIAATGILIGIFAIIYFIKSGCAKERKLSLHEKPSMRYKYKFIPSRIQETVRLPALRGKDAPAISPVPV